MYLRTCCLIGLLGIWPFVAASDARAQAPDRPADELRQRLVEKYDRDGDGQLGPEERKAIGQDVRDGKLDMPPALRQRFGAEREPADRARWEKFREQRKKLLEKYDRDDDGQLGPEERKAIQQDIREGKLEVPDWLRQQWQQRERKPGGPQQRRPGGWDPGPFQEKINIETDVEYGKAGDRSLKLDVIQPKTANTDSLPVVVFIHGGGWRAGDKRGGVGRVAPLVATGDYAGVSVGYRLSGEATWPAQIHDCKAAIRWVRANAEDLGADPNRIGVWGGSAGGHLVNMLGTSGDLDELEGDCGSPDQSDRVNCVVAFCGPADFLAPKQFEGGRRPNAVDQLLGGKIEEHKELARQASPSTYVTDDDPPFLLVHGDSDQTVPYEQAEMFYESLKKAGVDVTLQTVKGGGHAVGGPEVIRRVNLFFAKHLRGEDIEVPDEPIDGGQPSRGQ